MRYAIPIDEIENTKTYRHSSIVKQSFLRTLAVRKIITNGFLVWKNTGKIPGNITGLNLLVVNDLIELQNIDVNY